MQINKLIRRKNFSTISGSFCREMFYLAAGVVGCFGDTSIGATISVIIAIVGVIALAGVVSWKAVGYVDSQVEKITIMLWGKILFVILSLLQASFQTMIKLDNF